jgi:hypothetical protein
MNLMADLMTSDEPGTVTANEINTSPPRAAF